LKKVIVIMAAVCIAASTFAQKAPTRVQQIWGAANSRIVNQQDQWFKDGEFLVCIQLLKVEAERWPQDYDVWTNLGWMEENIEHWDAALATYVRYRRHNPQDPDAALPEANYYERKKLYAKVPELLEPEIKRECHPNNFRILAYSYEKLKMYADCIRVWKTYLERNPTDGAAKHNLARVEKKLATNT
jgi:tetratricopeptide (TPR) repeat protein